ncbi:MAG TPA: hypothetical protein EYO76_13040 [Flavobacteriaceae bacterium]|nr:hypothetical protein [Flavobacteriaceae bacterium]
MKKLIFILLISFSWVNVAQEILDEGIVNSKMKMTTDNEMMKSQFEALGETEIVTYFKEDKVRVETDSPMSGESVTIIDKDKKKVLTLQNIPVVGKKYSLENYEEPKELDENIKVTKGDVTKIILGYECQQYDVVMKNEGVDMEMEVYTTEQIDAETQQTSQLGNQVKGFPLLMIINVKQQGMDMTMTYEVTGVNKEKVSDDMFDLTVPEGYSKMGDQ